MVSHTGRFRLRLDSSAVSTRDCLGPRNREKYVSDVGNCPTCLGGARTVAAQGSLRGTISAKGALENLLLSQGGM